jgi:hypothetical protein
MADLRSYLVDKRHWLDSFNSLDDINSINERYQPSARQWAFRFLASHYKQSSAMGIMLFLKIQNGNLVSVDDPYRALQTSQKKTIAENVLPVSQKGADIAEWYQQIDKDLAAGDVVSVASSGAVAKSQTAYDQKILGIVSTSPGQTLGQKQSDTDIQLALTGRVPVKMASTSAAINPGDNLTSANELGKAMKATKAGVTIGKALESWKPNSGKDTIMIFVNLSWVDPSIKITADGSLSSSIQTNDTISINQPAPTPTQQSHLLSASNSGKTNLNELQDLSATISALTSQVTGHESKLSDLQNQISSLSSAFAAKASESAFIKEMTTSPLSSFNASSAAELNLDTLDVKNATVSDKLNVLGKTTVNDLGITGNLTAGVLSIKGLDTDGNASINTLGGNLKLQSTGVGGIDILAGKFTIDTKGNLDVEGNATFAKDVTIKGKLATNIIAPVPDEDLIIALNKNKNDKKKSALVVKNDSGSGVVAINQMGDVIASGSGKFANIAANALHIVRGAQADTSATETVANGSAGSTVITAHETERTIFSPHVGKESLIYITPNSNTQGVMPYIARQTAVDTKAGNKGSFTIQIPNTVQKDIKINWWIVN